MSGASYTESRPSLLWLDLETTGLDPARGFILEAGWIMTSRTPWLESDWGSPRYSAVLPFDLDAAPLDDGVRAMHQASGLRDECRALFDQGHLEYPRTLRKIEDDILDTLGSPVDAPEAPYLAGASVHFDLAWLRVHMPRVAARVSYRVYDVSAMVLFCRSLGMPKPEELKNKPHRTLPDLDNAIGLARRCAEWLDGAALDPSRSFVDAGRARESAWTAGMPPAEPGRCPAYWRSRYSGLWLRCTREERHEGTCRAGGHWRDESEWGVQSDG